MAALDHFAFLKRSFAGVPLGDALTFVLIAIVVFLVLRTIRALALRYLRHTKDDGSQTDLRRLLVHLVHSTSWLFLLLLALYCGTYAIPLNARTAMAVATIIQVAVLFQLGIWGARITLFAIGDFVKRRPQGNDARLTTAMGAITFITQVAVWSIVGLLILSALHINITGLVAGLGIGGVAVALATQNILGDIFASLSIVFDQPFSVGHFIVVGDMAGTVEHVGIKSTRIRSLSGELIVQSNASLLGARIHNYKHFSERRILFTVGVTYDTPYEKLVAIPGMVREAVQAVDKTRFDRAHFKEFADSSLNFEIVYYVLSPDYTVYMDIQQQINLALFKRFTDEDISFAFPSRTLYVNNLTPPPEPPPHIQEAKI